MVVIDDESCGKPIKYCELSMVQVKQISLALFCPARDVPSLRLVVENDPSSTRGADSPSGPARVPRGKYPSNCPPGLDELVGIVLPC